MTRQARPKRRGQTIDRNVPKSPARSKARRLKLQLNEIAFEAIKMAIITCEIAPGAELSEGLLAAQCKVGKAPIRNALSRLQQEGWVRSIPRQGHIVAPISLHDVSEIFNMREILEPEVTRNAAGNISPDRLRELNAECQRYYVRPDARAKRRLLLAHLRFHVEVAAATGNQRITRVLEQLHHESLRLFYLGIGPKDLNRDWQRGHDRLAEALIEGNGDKAARLVREGIRRTRREVLEALAQAPPGLTDRGWSPTGPQAAAKGPLPCTTWSGARRGLAQNPTRP